MSQTEPSPTQQASVPGVWHQVRGLLLPALEVRVTPDSVALLLNGKVSEVKLTSAQLASDAMSSERIAAVIAATRELLATPGLAKSRVKLIVSDQWLRPMIQNLSATSLTDAEIEPLVGHRYRQVFGNQMQGWVWRWVQQTDGSLLAMAWPESLLTGLRDAITAWGGTLASALPQSLDAAHRATTVRGDVWVVLAAPRGATVLRITDGALRLWRYQSLATSPDGKILEAVSDFILREVARFADGCRNLVIVNASAGAGWARELGRALASEGWTSRTVEHDVRPSGRWPRFDFADAPGRATKIRHALFATAALVVGLGFGVVAYEMQTMAAERAQLEDQRGRLQKKLRPVADPLVSKEMTQRVLAARDMVSRLSIPWEALLGTIESVRGDKVIIESLRPDLPGAKVEITARAQTFDEVSGFLDRLNKSEKLRQATLVSEAVTRESGIRFVVTAAWSDLE